MEILIISDLHGRSYWRQFINKAKEYTFVVILGDLFDSYHIKANDQIINAKEILQFAKENTNVIFIPGNHDLSYLDPFMYPCSGYRLYMAIEAKNLLIENKDMFVYAVELDGFLFSHAGVSSVWLDRYNRENELHITERINKAIKEHPHSLNFEKNQGKYFSNSGDDITQSPVWIRPKSLSKVSAHSKQVVGHTCQNKPNVIKSNSGLIYLTDSPEYYSVISNGEFNYYKYD